MNQFSQASKVLTNAIKRDDPSFDFYSRSYLHTSICNLLHLKEEINFEKICELTPKKVGSRSAILVVLQEAMDLGYFLKKGSEKDKRLRIYSLSDSFADAIDKTFRESFEKVL